MRDTLDVVAAATVAVLVELATRSTAVGFLLDVPQLKWASIAILATVGVSLGAIHAANLLAAVGVLRGWWTETATDTAREAGVVTAQPLLALLTAVNLGRALVFAFALLHYNVVSLAEFLNY